MRGLVGLCEGSQVHAALQAPGGTGARVQQIGAIEDAGCGLRPTVGIAPGHGLPGLAGGDFLHGVAGRHARVRTLRFGLEPVDLRLDQGFGRRTQGGGLEALVDQDADH